MAEFAVHDKFCHFFVYVLMVEHFLSFYKFLEMK